MSLHEINQRWLATEGLDEETVALRRRLDDATAACGPKPSWWRFGARKAWRADHARRIAEIQDSL